MNSIAKRDHFLVLYIDKGGVNRSKMIGYLYLRMSKRVYCCKKPLEYQTCPSKRPIPKELFRWRRLVLFTNF